MKQIILTTLILISLVGCKTPDSRKLDTPTQRAMRGNFRIASVSFPGSDVIKVNAFELADSQCFVGSQWNFVANNNSGSFVLNGRANCPSYDTKITWYVNKEGNVVLKFLDQGIKARKIKEGYVLRVGNTSDTGFQLIDKINVGSKPTDVIYEFVKI